MLAIVLSTNFQSTYSLNPIKLRKCQIIKFRCLNSFISLNTMNSFLSWKNSILNKKKTIEDGLCVE